MTTIYTSASVSADGYIAGPGESGLNHLFHWTTNGDTPPDIGMDLPMRMSTPSARYYTDMLKATGALLVGRRLYDLTNGWGGRHPLRCPVVVLTHQAPLTGDTDHFTFITSGITTAVTTARELAAGRNVAVNAGSIASQCLEAGLLDEIRMDVVPVLLGGGIPYFSLFGAAPIPLEHKETITGDGVTHLRYRVSRRPSP